MLNNTMIIIKLNSYRWVIIYFENSLYLNLSPSVRFKAKISPGFIFRLTISKNTLAECIRRSHESALHTGSIFFQLPFVKRIFTYITQISLTDFLIDREESILWT